MAFISLTVLCDSIVDRALDKVPEERWFVKVVAFRKCDILPLNADNYLLGREGEIALSKRNDPNCFYSNGDYFISIEEARHIQSVILCRTRIKEDSSYLYRYCSYCFCFIPVILDFIVHQSVD